MNKKNQRFIFITGGVVSSLGKGLLAASLGSLLEDQNYSLRLIKCDPYLNVDPGTMSPFQHGEVYVTEDGAETDMDLGHYERFTSAPLKKKNSITTGQVYENVILKERKGLYLGSTVQVIPHITDEIKSRIHTAGEQADLVIVEIGGTVGDIESLPFIEAIRQMRVDLGFENTVFVHLTLVPYVSSAGEVKSKPTQHSVKALREVGIQPDFLICRSSQKISTELRKKIALFCSVGESNVISAPDVKIIYEVPLILQKENFDKKLLARLKLKAAIGSSMSEWKKMFHTVKEPEHKLSIGLVGKYVNLKDSYQSIHEALVHSGAVHKTGINVQYIDSENLNDDNVSEKLGSLDAVLIPGGFGRRGLAGKISAVRYVRENNIPFLGICLGMQTAALEFARNVCGLVKAKSREFQTDSEKDADYVIDYMEGQTSALEKGGSMRLGSYSCLLKKDSRAREIYGKDRIFERHRHRLEFNNKFKKLFEKKGMVFSGSHPDLNLVEIMEIPSHPWFLAVQFHPEFQSKPLKAHPLFLSFILAGLQKKLASKLPKSVKKPYTLTGKNPSVSLRV